MTRPPLFGRLYEGVYEELEVVRIGPDVCLLNFLFRLRLLLIEVWRRKRGSSKIDRIDSMWTCMKAGYAAPGCDAK